MPMNAAPADNLVFFVIQRSLYDLFIEMYHLGTELVPFGMSIYQRLALLCVTSDSLQEHHIRFAEYVTVVYLRLEIEQPWKSLFLETCYQCLDYAEFTRCIHQLILPGRGRDKLHSDTPCIVSIEQDLPVDWRYGHCVNDRGRHLPCQPV